MDQEECGTRKVSSVEKDQTSQCRKEVRRACFPISLKSKLVRARREACVRFSDNSDSDSGKGCHSVSMKS